MLAWYLSNKSAMALENRVLQEIASFNGIRVYPIDSFDDAHEIEIAYTSPTWIANQLAANFDPELFQRVFEIQLGPHAREDAKLVQIAELPHLKKLGIYDGSFTLVAVQSFRQKRPDVELEIHQVD